MNGPLCGNWLDRVPGNEEARLAEGESTSAWKSEANPTYPPGEEWRADMPGKPGSTTSSPESWDRDD